MTPGTWPAAPCGEAGHALYDWGGDVQVTEDGLENVCCGHQWRPKFVFNVAVYKPRLDHIDKTAYLCWSVKPEGPP